MNAWGCWQGRIVGVVEFGPGAEASQRLAVRLARQGDALLDLVSVVDGFREIFVHRNRSLLADPDAFLAEVRAGLEVRVRRARALGVRCIGTVLVGTPDLEIPRHALRTRADVVVSPWEGGVGLQLGGALPWAPAKWTQGWEEVRRIEAL